MFESAYRIAWSAIDRETGLKGAGLAMVLVEMEKSRDLEISLYI